MVQKSYFNSETILLLFICIFQASFLPNNVVSTQESMPPARDGYNTSVGKLFINLLEIFEVV